MPKSQDEVVPPPFAQWLLWEEQSNFSGFRTTTEQVALEVSHVPRAQVCAWSSRRTRLRELVARFVDEAHVRFPKHPLNRDPSVAFSGNPVAERWSARFTSSRTLVVAGPARRGRSR